MVEETAMREKPYYSVRTGKNEMSGKIDLPMFRRIFRPIYTKFSYEGYFQEYLGFECNDAGFIPGKIGRDVEGALLIALRKDNLWPIYDKLSKYTEDDIFDIIEFLYEHCSKPTKREYHEWSDCGWHCSEFDQDSGREEFRMEINSILKIYGEGYELSIEGEILILPDVGLDTLLEAPLPVLDPENVEARIDAACTKFRRSRASLDERHDAIRDLADVLEYLRPKMKGVITAKDEDDLFNIANNFGIRHHNKSQKTNYDKAIWYSWLFHYYLATIHAVLRLIAKANPKSPSV